MHLSGWRVHLYLLDAAWSGCDLTPRPLYDHTLYTNSKKFTY